MRYSFWFRSLNGWVKYRELPLGTSYEEAQLQYDQYCQGITLETCLAIETYYDKAKAKTKQNPAFLAVLPRPNISEV